MTPSSSRKGRPITAGKLLESLEKDPEYIARLEEFERHKQEASRDYDQAAAPVLKELSQVGFVLDPAYGLSDILRNEQYRNEVSYKQALPILLSWLPRILDRYVKEDIVRTLSVKWAKPVAAPNLIDEFRHAQGTSGLKWAIGNALSVVADDSVFDDIVKLVQDKKHGKAREMVAVALGNMKNPLAVDVLIELLKDDEVAGHALIALGKLKSWKARPYIEPFLEHPKAWVRKEAKRALAKIDKAK